MVKEKEKDHLRFECSETLRMKLAETGLDSVWHPVQQSGRLVAT